jgi:hypothetical protein
MQITKKDIYGGKFGVNRFKLRVEDARLALIMVSSCFKEIEKHEVDKQLGKIIRFLDSIEYKD